MKTTVYITNHNYGQYIEQAIESVLDQNFKDYELLIIDDGSTDNSHTIMERYRKHPKVSLIFQENKGLNVTNNIAIKSARGKYLIRLDADDYFDQNALLVMTNYLDQNPDIALVFPDYYLVGENGEILSLQRRHDFKNDVTLYDQPAHGAGTMIRRKCMLEVGGYWEDFQCQDGYDIWLKISTQYKVSNINLPMFYYRQHTSSLTKNELLLLTTRHEIIKRNTESIEEKNTWKTAVILPIRGNSKHESFALRPFAGTTLLDITLKELQQASGIYKKIISTPDENILVHIQKYYPDIIVNHRPDHLAKINTHLEDTIAHTMDCNSEIFADVQLVMILHIEAPFRQAFYLDKAINTSKLFETDTLIAVRPDDSLFFKHQGQGLEPLQQQRLRLERDFIYRQVGAMRVFRKEFFLENRKLTGGRMGHIVMDELASITVNSELNWKISEHLYQQQFTSKK